MFGCRVPFRDVAAFAVSPTVALLIGIGSAQILAQPVADGLVSQVHVRYSATALGEAGAPIMSGDGQWLVFLSSASNLATNDANGLLTDVFLRDMASGEVSLVSINTNGVSGTGRSEAPSISRDGQVIAFASTAADLVPSDTNALADVFVRTLSDGKTRLISRAPDGGSANGPSSNPVVSGDGRYVYFECRATNLVPGFATGVMSLFRASLLTGEIAPVNAPATNLLSRSWGASPSHDGERVVHLSAPDAVVFQDMATGVSQVVNSFTGLPQPVTRISVTPQLSADGRVAVFLASAGGTSTGGVYRVDLANESAEKLAPNLDTLFPLRRGGATTTLVSHDGTVVLFEALSTNSPPDGPETVYEWNATTRALSLVSSNAVRLAGTEETLPFGQLAAASPDGRFVAWLSFETPGAIWPSNEPLQLFVQDRSTGETRRITRTPAGEPASVSTEYPAASFSEDGRFLAFQSAAPDLVLDDLNDGNDVFVYDWESDRLELVSRRSESQPSSTNPGLSFAAPQSISSDGRYLAFVSSVPGLTQEEIKAVPNVFVHDLTGATNRLASVNELGEPANRTCGNAALSADGRWVAFSSLASNLVPGDTNGVQDVFLSDLQDRKIYLVSRGGEGASANADSSHPVLSPDGSQIAFISSASNLVAGDFNRAQDVFVFDRIRGSVRLASATPGAESGAGSSWSPIFSPDGSWLVFESTASNLVPGFAASGPHVYAWRGSDGTLRRLTSQAIGVIGRGRAMAFSGNSRVLVFEVKPFGARTDLVMHEFDSGQTVPLLDGASAPALDFEGNHLVYLGAASPSVPQPVMLLDRATSFNSLVSVSFEQSASANGRSFAPLITPDGRFVIFASKANDLVPNDTNFVTDIFVRDLQAGHTFLLTKSILGEASGNGKSVLPFLGQDGRTIVFTSFASDLAGHDFNEQADLYVARLPGAESGFRVLSIARLSTGEVTLVWSAREGASYRVESTDVIGSQWEPLTVAVRIENGQASAVAPSPRGADAIARFYRVVEMGP